MKPHFLCSLILCLWMGNSCSFGQAPAALPGPSKEHAWLNQFIGQWATKSTAVMGPDQPSMECKGTLSSRSLAGFWVLNELKGSWAGDAMTGIQTIGYDAVKGKYVGTWVDSMTAYMWQYEGTVDATGKVLTLQAEGPNFIAQGKLTKFEDIYEFKSANEIAMTSRMLGEDGKWVIFMSGTATRIK